MLVVPAGSDSQASLAAVNIQHSEEHPHEAYTAAKAEDNALSDLVPKTVPDEV